MPNQSSASRSPSNGFFLSCLGVFIASALVFGLFLKLDRRIEKTSGKVIETFTKRTFASRKQSYDQDFFVVSYTVRGKEYTIKTMRRNGFGQDYIPVYYYSALPGFAWCYKKANPNSIYCSIVMVLSLVATGTAWSNLRRSKMAAKAVTAKKKKG